MPSPSADGGIDLFEDPEGFYKPEPEPTFAQHALADGTVLDLRLVGHNPLWGHLLWNAGRTVTSYLEARAEEIIQGNSVLELGAGAGLPSLLCAIKGASIVVVTDYPDEDLRQNLLYNIDHCHAAPKNVSVYAEGYLWGNTPDKLLSHLPSGTAAQGFDVLILADLLFNHSEHTKLVSSVKQTLKRAPSARALVFFTPHRPWLLQNDLAFFDVARQSGLAVYKVLEEVMDRIMFDEDPGDELLRRTVFGYELRWSDLVSDDTLSAEHTPKPLRSPHLPSIGSSADSNSWSGPNLTMT